MDGPSDAQPEARYDGIADFYVGESGGTAADVVSQTLLELLGDVGSLRVLDLACGEGRLSRELAHRGAAVVGVDLSQRLLARARSRDDEDALGIGYLIGDAHGIEWWDGEAFDVVVCNHGLADIDDLDAAVGTVATVLAPRGTFAFSILHPCCPGNGSTTPSAWPPAAGYGTEGWWLADNPGMRGKVGSTFRRLSTYLNTATRRGLSVVDVAEPASDEVPMFLVVTCRRTR